MVNQNTQTTEQEAQLIEAFRANPELFDLFSDVIEVYQNDPKEFESLSAIETYLLGKLREIGNNALGRWAESLEKEVSAIEGTKQGVHKSSKKNSTSLAC